MSNQATREAGHLRLKGNEFFEQLEYEKAVALYSQSLEKHETSKTLLGRALAYMKLGRHHEAYVDASEAIEYDKYNMEAHLQKALALIELNRQKGAIRALEICVKLRPEDMKVMALLEVTRNLLDDASQENDESDQFARFTADKNCCLVEGIRFYLFKKNDDMLCASTWDESIAKLRNCHYPLDCVIIGGFDLKRNVVDFFRSVESVRLAKDLTFLAVDFSAANGALFTELFRDIVCPNVIVLQDIRGISGELFSTSLNKLAGFKAVDFLNICACEPMVNFKLNVDDVIKFLHLYEPVRCRVVYLQSEFFKVKLDVIVDKLLKIFTTDTKRSQFELTISYPQKIKMPKECGLTNSVTGEILTVRQAYQETDVFTQFMTCTLVRRGFCVKIQRH